MRLGNYFCACIQQEMNSENKGMVRVGTRNGRECCYRVRNDDSWLNQEGWVGEDMLKREVDYLEFCYVKTDAESP